MITNTEFQLFVIVVAIVGVVGACWSWRGAASVYEQIGRGYLDVSDLDPEAPHSLQDDLEERGQLMEALRFLRQKRERPAIADSLVRAYAALNSGDTRPFASLCDPNVEWIETEGPRSGIYRGRAGVRECLRHAARNPDVVNEPLELTQLRPDLVLVLVDRKARFDETREAVSAVAQLFELHDGSVKRMRSYGNPHRAFRAAGIDPWKREEAA